MKQAKLKKILAFSLALVMILPLMPVVTFAETDPNIIFEQDFSTATDYAEANLLNGAAPWGVFKTVPEVVDGKLIVPINEENHDNRIYMHHDAVNSTNVEVIVWETEFTFSEDANDNQGFRIRIPELDFDKTTFANGTEATRGDWPNLAYVKSSGVWYPNDAGTYTPGHVKITPGESYNFKMIINMVEGTICTYVNGILDNAAPGIYAQKNSTEVFYYADVANMRFKADRMLFNPVFYEGGSPTATCKIDNIKVYRDDNTIPVEYNGSKMNVPKDSEFLIRKDNFTYQFAEVTKGEDTWYTASNKVKIDDFGYKINATFAEGDYYLIQDMNILQSVADLKADYGFKGDIPAAGLFENAKYTEAGTGVENTYLKFPFKAGTGANGTGDGGFVDKNLAYMNKAVSYLDMPVVEFSADYFFSAGSKANVQAQLKIADYVDAEGATKDKMWIDLWFIGFNGEATGKLGSSGTRVTPAEGETLAEPKAGEWFTVSAIVNLVTGKYDLFLNGELYATDATLKGGDGTELTKISIREGSFLASKINKLGKTYYDNTVDQFVEGSYLGVDNVILQDGPKVNVVLDGVETKLVIDSEYNFLREGKIFQEAAITYAIPEGSPAGTAAKVELVKGSVASSMMITPEMEGATIVTTYVDVLYLYDFEDANCTVDQAIVKNAADAPTPFKGVHTYQVIKSEGEGDAADQFLRIPFQGVAAAFKHDTNGGNFDNSLALYTPEISYETTEKVVLSIDYRPHFYELPKADAGYDYEGDAQQDPTVETQWKLINSKKGDGTRGDTMWISLYNINLKTGHLGNAGTPVDDAQHLVNDQWNNIKLIINLKTGKYDTYVNDDLYATEGYISGSNDDAGLNDIILSGNQLLVAKTNKKVGAYRKDETQPISDKEMSYVDVDDITLRYVKDIAFTVDGYDRKVKEDEMFDLTKKNTELVLAIKKIGDRVEYITDMQVKPEEGMEILTSYVRSFKTLSKAEFRLGLPSGIRFVTVIHENDLRDLRFLDIYDEKGNPDGAIKEVKYGTIIAPADFLAEGEDFTMETLDAKGTNGYVKVYATPNQEYNYTGKVADTATVFAGSLTNIKEENLTRDFIGRGFIEIVLPDDTVMTYYAEWSNTTANLSELAEAALSDKANANASDLVKEFIGSFIVAG